MTTLIERVRKGLSRANRADVAILDRRIARTEDLLAELRERRFSLALADIDCRVDIALDAAPIVTQEERDALLRDPSDAQPAPADDGSQIAEGATS